MKINLKLLSIVLLIGVSALEAQDDFKDESFSLKRLNVGSHPMIPDTLNETEAKTPQNKTKMVLKKMAVHSQPIILKKSNVRVPMVGSTVSNIYYNCEPSIDVSKIDNRCARMPGKDNKLVVCNYRAGTTPPFIGVKGCVPVQK